MWITPLVLLLVLLAAGLHATWNLLVKSGEDTLIAAWLTVLIPPVLLWPFLFLTGLPAREAWPMLLGSGAIHAAHNVCLARAYEHGDLSVVYPVARGLAPLLVGLGDPLGGQRVSASAVVTIGLILLAVAMQGEPAHRRRDRHLPRTPLAEQSDARSPAARESTAAQAAFSRRTSRWGKGISIRCSRNRSTTAR